MNINPSEASSLRNKNIRVIIHILMAFLFAFVFNGAIHFLLGFLGFSFDTKIADVGIAWGLVYVFGIALLGIGIYAPIWLLTAYMFKVLKV